MKLHNRTLTIILLSGWYMLGRLLVRLAVALLVDACTILSIDSVSGLKKHLDVVYDGLVTNRARGFLVVPSFYVLVRCARQCEIGCHSL